jgi:hypothetical protein
MAKIFLSHSSSDKDFVRRLKESLLAHGHEPWLDEDKINVGDYISDKIALGIEDCDFLVLVLSENAISSGWVKAEWRAKHMAEIETGRITLLPILKEHCPIPVLLKGKKYADFASNYEAGLADLLKAVQPHSSDSLLGLEGFDHVSQTKEFLIPTITTKNYGASFTNLKAKYIEASIRINVKNASKFLVSHFRVELYLPKQASNTIDYKTNPLPKLLSHEDDGKDVFAIDVAQPVYPGQSVGLDFGIIQVKRANSTAFYEEGVIIKIYSEKGTEECTFEVRSLFLNQQRQILGPDDFI